tara:strand:+ start:940 stop:2874 length:1935 start_codon:yes stop_codon:yes gene_type:complete
VKKDILENIKDLSFRYDINFLRAASVFVVVIYHIDKKFLPGGWLGVDIFFFISGYLISNKILNDLKSENFKFKNFYIKRIRRILPALISSLIFTIPFAFALLPPQELYLYLSSFQSTLFFYSNIFFQNLDFYNTPSSKYFPLLHMWSLSIEEQFYILFPMALFVIYKFSRKNLLTVLFLLTFVSITFNLLNFGNIIFYQLHFRIWEFLFGVLYMLFENKIKLTISFKHAGLLVLLFAFTFFHDGMINNIYTKIICLLSVILYLSSNEESQLTNFLNKNKIIQLFGMISFSLYLFHQPIFVFYRIYNDRVNELNNSILLLLIIFLLIISYINWKFVEIPFQKKFFKRKKIFLSSVFIILSIFSISLLDDYSFLDRFTDFPKKALLLSFKNQDVISQNGVDCDNRSVRQTCEFKGDEANQNIFVIGDSSLRTLSTALLEDENINNYNLLHFGGDDCLYLVGVKLSENSCPNKEIASMDSFVSEIENSIIIYGGRIPRYLSGTGFDNSFVKEENDIKVIQNFEEKLLQTLNFLQNKNKVILLYPIPEQGWNVPELYFYGKFEWGDTISYPSSIWYKRVETSNKILDKVNSQNLFRIYPDKIFCDSFLIDQCVAAYKDNIYYQDDDHLSIEGSRLLAREILLLLSNRN